MSDELIDMYYETEETLKAIIRRYLENEEDIQNLHDDLISQLNSWNLKVYP